MATLCRDAVRRQANKAAFVSGCLPDVVWRNRNMRLEGKVCVYKACVRPILTYAIEARSDTVDTKRIFRTTEMKTLRSIAGKTLFDRIPNDAIRDIYQIQYVIRWGRRRRQEWNQHVSRMRAERLIRLTRDNMPTGARRAGKPFKMWRDNWQAIFQEQD